MSSWLQLFLLAFFGSVVGISGGIVFLYGGSLSGILRKHSVPFAAGVLITVSFLGLIPEAIEQVGESALLIVLLSFFGAFLFEHFLIHIHHHDGYSKDDVKAPVALVIIGDTIHNFIDGIAIAASFFVSPGLGFVTAFSTFLHEVPHEVGDFGILLKAGWKKRDVLLVNLVSALFTIVGAFTTYVVAEGTTFVGAMLAVSAGIFLYLGTVDFLPHIGEGYSNKLKSFVPLALGVIIMLVTLMLVPHSS